MRLASLFTLPFVLFFATLGLAQGTKVDSVLLDAIKKQRESVEKQRASVRRQLIPFEQKLDNPWPAPALAMNSVFVADCPALPATELEGLVGEAAKEYALDPAILRAVIRQESGFRPCAVSVRGAQGLMQLMPSTARKFQVKDVFDARENVRAGSAYLKQLLDRYHGDLRLALVAYNAGPGRADLDGLIEYPLETQNYVANIFAELDETVEAP